MNQLIPEACTILFPVTKEDIEVPRGEKPSAPGLIVSKESQESSLAQEAGPEPFSRGQQRQGVIFLLRGSLEGPEVSEYRGWW